MALLRQSIYSRLAGYEDVNDADRLSIDPVMRQVIGGRAARTLPGDAPARPPVRKYNTEGRTCVKRQQLHKTTDCLHLRAISAPQQRTAGESDSEKDVFSGNRKDGLATDGGGGNLCAEIAPQNILSMFHMGNVSSEEFWASTALD